MIDEKVVVFVDKSNKLEFDIILFGGDMYSSIYDEMKKDDDYDFSTSLEMKYSMTFTTMHEYLQNFAKEEYRPMTLLPPFIDETSMLYQPSFHISTKQIIKNFVIEYLEIHENISNSKKS